MSEPTDPLASNDLTPPSGLPDVDPSTRDQAPRRTMVRVPFSPGRPVPNRPSWTLVRQLGSGGFGEVWQAKHEWRKELGAVKFCTHPDARVQLVSHEKKVIVRVMRYAGDHPHIVPLIDYDLGGDVPWLMFEYVEGGTLSDAVRDWRDLPVPRRLGRTVVTLYGIARALKRVHRLDPPIVHRDLKPANVLMSRGLPRVTDFGISGAAVRPGPTGRFDPPSDLSVQLPTMLRSMGTFRYASPEQMFGSPPNPRDDVYALGIIAYQLALADLNAAPGTDAADILRELQAPKEFISLVVRSVAMDPVRRPRDATEWEHTLRPWVPKKSDLPSGSSTHAAQATPQAIHNTPRTVSPPPPSTLSPALRPTESAPRAPAPEPAADPVPTTEKLSITVPGVLLARPARDSTAAWKEIAKLPAAVELDPALVYCVRARESVTDADLAGFRAIPLASPVRYINLSWCAHLTDAGLEHLKDVRALKGLDLTGCKRITDAGLAHIRKLGALRNLSLRWCALVTDAGLARLRRLTSLRNLDLMGCCELTDATLARVCTHTKLRQLNLRWCEQLTDAGLVRLTKLAGLRYLGLLNCTNLTEAGAAAVKAALPDCEIER